MSLVPPNQSTEELQAPGWIQESSESEIMILTNMDISSKRIKSTSRLMGLGWEDKRNFSTADTAYWLWIFTGCIWFLSNVYLYSIVSTETDETVPACFLLYAPWEKGKPKPHPFFCKQPDDLCKYTKSYSKSLPHFYCYFIAPGIEALICIPYFVHSLMLLKRKKKAGFPWKKQGGSNSIDRYNYFNIKAGARGNAIWWFQLLKIQALGVYIRARECV